MQNFTDLEKQYSQEWFLLPVSKKQPIHKIEELLLAGKIPARLAENYSQELQEKARYFESKGTSIEWHYLGRLQSKKIKDIVNCAAYLHSVCREKELVELAKYPEKNFKFFVQVNISGEESKGGILPADIAKFVLRIAELNLKEKFCGFMGMAAPLEEVGEDTVREQFKSLRELRDRINKILWLNMGMSDDYKIALEEGSNWIRIGTAIFGSREQIN